MTVAKASNIFRSEV